MSDLNTFNLPDVGEGLTEAEIVSWKVKPGDPVAINDVIVEIETAKSLVELPSPYAGVVAELLVAEGVTVEVGTPIIAVNSSPAVEGARNVTPVVEGVRNERVETPAVESARNETPAVESARNETPAVEGARNETPAVEGARDETPAVEGARDETPAVEGAPASRNQPADTAGSLVGSGPKADAVKRRPRKASPVAAQSPVPAPAAPASAASVPAGPDPDTQGPASYSIAAPAEPAEPSGTAPSAAAPASPAAVVQERLNKFIHKVLAKPPVRKAARDLGIDLADVTATGVRGEVTKQDLLSYQAQREAEVAQAGEFWGPSKKPQGQRIERIPVRGVRKATAKAMVESAFSAPHVSIFVDVDASRTMEFVKRLKTSRDFEGIKVSPLLILAKAVIWAAARNPSVNATWAGDEIIVKHYMNLGIAAATPRGLLVPNIKDAQDLSLKELAVALSDLAATARAGKTKPADMQDGTLTITNIGALGIDTGTPIINPGEVAIVAFGTIRQKPWVVSGEVIPRWITTLGGSFDHRVVDGDLSARFMADVAAIMEEPALLLE
jgi:2-oxoisovalerate dehydrogenase E2 component (dihydrolipoyl transacylase)